MALRSQLLEAAPRILGRVASAKTANFFHDLHQSHGVEILKNTALDGFILKNENITAAKFSDDRKIAADLVLVRIGIVPDNDLAIQASLAVDQGIVVDQYTKTSDPNIFVAEDCARFPYREQLLRLELVQNTNDQDDLRRRQYVGCYRDIPP
ncbi:MAG: FAD-dependent oxidoreductase [Alphaproteobacteria bacterium]|nr:FAD-dependent oxidoreductase [Alphaproteobacteria bacterium]